MSMQETAAPPLLSIQGETADGAECFLLVGREVGGPRIQLMTLVDGREPHAVDFGPEAAALLHARLGALLEGEPETASRH